LKSKQVGKLMARWSAEVEQDLRRFGVVPDIEIARMMQQYAEHQPNPPPNTTPRPSIGVDQQMIDEGEET